MHIYGLNKKMETCKISLSFILQFSQRWASFACNNCFNTSRNSHKYCTVPGEYELIPQAEPVPVFFRDDGWQKWSLLRCSETHQMFSYVKSLIESHLKSSASL